MKHGASLTLTLALLLGGILLLCGCAALDPIPAGVCGNGVVEPGEDCDGFASEAGTVCSLPGQPHPCRFVCAAAAPCPAGMGCGADGVCRRPSGSFVTPGVWVPGEASGVELADFDGDGQDDLLTRSRPDLVGRCLSSLHFAEPDGQSFAPFGFPSLLGFPSAGDLDGDGRADLIFTSDMIAFAALAGNADRTFRPVPTPLVAFDVGAQADVLALDVLPTVRERPSAGADEKIAHDGDEIVMLIRSPDGAALFPFGGTPELPLLVLDAGAHTLAAPLQAGQLIEGALSPCPEIVFAFEGEDHVHLFSPCARQGLGFAWNYNGTALEVPLAAGAKIQQGVVVADVDHDGHLDLLVDATPPGESKAVWYLGRGDGQGGFAPLAARQREHGLGRLPDVFGSEFPLVAADLNGDGVVDYLTGRLLLVSTDGLADSPGVLGAPSYDLEASRLTSSWSEAQTGDFNGDGLPDLAAAAASSQEIDLLLAADDGTYTQLAIATRGKPILLRGGDFDGDGVGDLAFVEQGVHGDAEPGQVEGVGDTPAILFGQAAGPAAEIRRLGEIERVSDMTAGSLLLNPLSTHPDGADDLVVVAAAENGDARGIVYFGGSAGRLPIASVVLGESDSTVTGIPLVPVLGRFTSKDAAGVALFAQDPPTQDVPADVRDQDKECRWLAQLADQVSQHFWLAPWGGTVLDPPRAGPAVQLPWIGCGVKRGFTLSFVAADVDGDGLDELAGLQQGATPSGGTAPPATLLLVEAAEQGGVWRMGTPRSVALDEAVASPPRLVADDLDGDRFPDLVIVPAGSGTDAAAGAGGSSLRVLWNDGLGGFAATRSTSVTLPEGGVVRDFAASRFDTAGLYASSPKGVYRVACPPGSHRALTAVAVEGVAGGSALAVGDVDGDRLDDLAVGGQDGVRVHRGEAVQP